MRCMDHEFTLPKNYYVGKYDIHVLYNVGPGGILLTATTTPLIDFNWHLIKDMVRPDGVCGHKINQFMVDQFKKRDMYNYVAILKTLKGQLTCMGIR